MFRALWNHFFSRDRKRKIFAYWDGVRIRKIDPLVVSERLDKHKEFVFDKHVPACERGEVDAQLVVVDAICEAFDVRPWSEDHPGLTRGECFELFADYVEYLDALKKNTAPPVTLPSPTGSDSSAENSTTKPASDSG